MFANAACHLGLTRALAESDVAPEARLPYAATHDNFYRGARNGLAAEIRWIDGKHHIARDFWLAIGLPLAARGLADFGLAQDEIDRYLGIIEARVRTGQTGSAWQLGRLARSAGADQGSAATAMLADYLENQRSAAPVHEWNL